MHVACTLYPRCCCVAILEQKGVHFYLVPLDLPLSRFVLFNPRYYACDICVLGLTLVDVPFASPFGVVKRARLHFNGLASSLKILQASQCTHSRFPELRCLYRTEHAVEGEACGAKSGFA